MAADKSLRHAAIGRNGCTINPNIFYWALRCHPARADMLSVRTSPTQEQI